MSEVALQTNGQSHSNAAPPPWHETYSTNLPLNDALPYFDREIETQPGLQSRVEKAIKDELTLVKEEHRGKAADDERLPPRVSVFEVRDGR